MTDFKSKIANQKAFGARGEAIASKFFAKEGYELIDRNYHAQGGEIDLIVKKPGSDEYVFVEVKTRRSEAFGDGKSAITRTKFERILSAVEAFFLKKLELPDVLDFRVDALILRFCNDKIFYEHIENIGPEDFENY